MSKKKINKRYKLTKELFNELKEMCDAISYDLHNNFIKKYSKRKTIEAKTIRKIFEEYFDKIITKTVSNEPYDLKYRKVLACMREIIINSIPMNYYK